MRPFTIAYGFMTLSLGSVLAYALHDAPEVRSLFGDTHTSAANTKAPQLATIVSSAAPVTTSATTTETTTTSAASPSSVTLSDDADDMPSLTLGMTSDQVLEELGQPDSISDNGTRWAYGSRIMIFNSQNCLAGEVTFDPVQAAANRYSQLLASLNDASSAKSKSGSGPKIMRLRVAQSQRYDKYRYQPVAAGSARNAYRYEDQGQNSAEYSYYMNRYGPNSRTYYQEPFLPRGMSTVAQRNVSPWYLPYANTRYGANPNLSYRR